jgi:putative DNA primase/helicase
MSRDEWDALVEEARARDMISVARQHGAKLSKYGTTEWVGPCPVCGTGRDRFSINPKKGVFNCRVCSKGGHGPVDLEMFLGGCNFVEAVKRLTNTISLSGKRLPTAKTADPERAAAHERERERDEAEQHETASWLWAQRQPIANSPVERYLLTRGYVGTIPPTIGYLPARGEYPHAMISAFALPNEIEPGKLGAPVVVSSVHLTKLKPDGSDRIRTNDGKIIIGRPLGLPIAVSSITDGLSLAISEGIEDALAYRLAGFAAWAAGAAPFIPALAEHVPDYITTVIIEQHIDPDQKAQHAVARLQALLHERQVRDGERPVEIKIREASDK